MRLAGGQGKLTVSRGGEEEAGETGRQQGRAPACALSVFLRQRQNAVPGHTGRAAACVPVPSALHLEVTLEGGFGHVPGLDAAQMPTWEHDLQGKSKGTGFMPPGGGERREEGNCPPLCPWGSEDVSG